LLKSPSPKSPVIPKLNLEIVVNSQTENESRIINEENKNSGQK
jgi:hypothetical protein